MLITKKLLEKSFFSKVPEFAGILMLVHKRLKRLIRTVKDILSILISQALVGIQAQKIVSINSEQITPGKLQQSINVQPFLNNFKLDVEFGMKT